MSEENEEFLSIGDLDHHEWRGLQQLARAGPTDYEPLAKRGKLGKTVADRLVSYGLAETGTLPRYPAKQFGPGYRLTRLGWRILDRGQYSTRP